jgi:hypothetical protein
LLVPVIGGPKPDGRYGPGYRSRRLPTVVTRNTMSPGIISRGRAAFWPIWFCKKGVWQAPRPCAGTSVGGSLVRRFVDPALQEEAPSRPLDISSGTPVVPAETKPTLSRGHTQGAPGPRNGFYRRWILPGLNDLAMGADRLDAYRRRTIGAASGLVLEIGRTRA